MNNLSKYSQRFTLYAILITSITAMVFVSVAIVGRAYWDLSENLSLLAGASSGIVVGSLGVFVLLRPIAIAPLQKIHEVITYAKGKSDPPAPDMSHPELSKEILEALSWEIYELTGSDKEVADTNEKTATHMPQLGAPTLALDSKGVITHASQAARDFFGLSEGIVGKKLEEVCTISYSDRSDAGIDSWLIQQRKASVTSSKLWENIFVVDHDQTRHQCHILSSFRQQDDSGVELVLTILDRTPAYKRTQNEISYVSMAVHELRTPLTMLRGYIEVFEDEVAPTLAPEHQVFLQKMLASTQQLKTFTHNILTMARVENDKLTLQLKKASWADVLQKSVESFKTRAQVKQHTIKLDIADNLPPVAIDNTSIMQVLNNLLDNALKYTKEPGKSVVVKAYMSKEGLITTDVIDQGIGIAESALPTLFNKYKRSFKSRDDTHGTGLGLFISREFISAHGGSIWVRSKEGKGTTISFTLHPYVSLTPGQRSGKDAIIVSDNQISNHSLRRN